MAKKARQRTISPSTSLQSTTTESPITFFLKKNFIWISICLSVVISLLIFDIKPSIGGDDSNYVYRANEFVKNFTYPGGFQGPLYPWVLSVFILLFGLNLVLLKFISLIFISASIYFFYKAFENEVNFSVLVITCLIYSINTTMLYYSSQTYSEALFMLLQSVSVWLIIKKVKMDGAEYSNGKVVKNVFLISLFSLLVYLTRSAGIFFIASFALYLLLIKQYRLLIINTALTGFFLVVFKTFEKFVLGIGSSSQLDSFLLVNSYKPELGTESLAGFLSRFTENIYTYLGRTFYEITFSLTENPSAAIPSLFVLSLILILAGSFWSIKKKSKVFFSAIYSIVFLVLISTLLQHYWINSRLIITIYPFVILVMVYGIEQLYKNILSSWKIGIIFLSTILIGAVFISSLKRINEQITVLKHNLSGDRLYGFSPDWINFIHTCEWSANNLPDTACVANRKSSIYYLYSNGRKGYNISLASQTNADSVLATMKKRGITHLIYDNFTWSGTVRKFIKPVAEKYPEKLKIVHKEGDDNNYPSYLIEIVY